MLKQITSVLMILGLYTLPKFAFAQVDLPGGGGEDPDLTGVEAFVNGLGDIVDTLIPLAAALALAVFFFGLARYILATEDEAKQKSRRIMINGIISLFIIAAIFGIVELLANIFGTETGGTLDPPEVIR